MVLPPEDYLVKLQKPTPRIIMLSCHPLSSYIFLLPSLRTFLFLTNNSTLEKHAQLEDLTSKFIVQVTNNLSA